MLQADCSERQVRVMTNCCSIKEAVAAYNEVLAEKYVALKKKPSKAKRALLRRETIYKTFEKLMARHNAEHPGIIWRMVQKAHVYSYLEQEGGNLEQTIKELGVEPEIIAQLLLNDELIHTIESAMQSWKRASGIAWENFFEDALEIGQNVEVNVVNAQDMGKLLGGGHIETQKGVPTPLHIRDSGQKKYFTEILDKKDFDLYLLFYSDAHEKWRLFGLIQCKTSIRDRVKINAATSLDVMGNHLWSILLALDPDNFLRGQYYNMAQKNWHGVYMLDNTTKVDGRIYSGQMDVLQQTIREHAKKVLQIITDDPTILNTTWQP